MTIEPYLPTIEEEEELFKEAHWFHTLSEFMVLFKLDSKRCVEDLKEFYPETAKELGYLLTKDEKQIAYLLKGL